MVVQQGKKTIYVIDGFNLIKSSFLKGEERQGIDWAVSSLLRILTAYWRRHPDTHFTVVLDGHPFLFNHQPGISTFFSGSITADEKIRLLLEKTSTRQKTVVISDDREVQSTAIILGASILSVSDFMNLLVPPKPVKTTKKAEKEICFQKALKIEKELQDYYEKKRKNFGSDKKVNP